MSMLWVMSFEFRTKIFSISNAVVEGVLLILNGQVDNGHICRVEGIGGVEFVKVELGKGNYLVVGIDEVTCSFDFLESSQSVRLQLVLDLLQKRRGKHFVSGTQQQPTQLITAACVSHWGNQLILFTFPLTPSVCVSSTWVSLPHQINDDGYVNSRLRIALWWLDSVHCWRTVARFDDRRLTADGDGIWHVDNTLQLRWRDALTMYFHCYPMIAQIDADTRGQKRVSTVNQSWWR